MKTIAIIPARCGSKGFPHKNIAKINEITLIEYAIKVGLRSPSISDVYISTDSKEYETIAMNAGAKSIGLRPKHLSQDNTKTSDVIISLLKQLNADYEFIVLLQPTSPVRSPEDIEKMIATIQAVGSDGAVSVSLLDEPHPFKLKQIVNNRIFPFINGTDSEINRQSLTKIYKLNGAIYIIKTLVFIKQSRFLTDNTVPYVMDSCYNIDSENDFILLNELVKSGKVKLYY